MTEWRRTLKHKLVVLAKYRFDEQVHISTLTEEIGKRVKAADIRRVVNSDVVEILFN